LFEHCLDSGFRFHGFEKRRSYYARIPVRKGPTTSHGLRATHPSTGRRGDDFLDTFFFRLNLLSVPWLPRTNQNQANQRKAAPVAPAAKPISKPAVKASAAPPPVKASVAPPPVKASAAPQPAKARAPYEPTQEEIQTRAFEIYVSEGCKEGNDLEYWVRAEQELEQELAVA
jgi:hypothetical protein